MGCNVMPLKKYAEISYRVKCVAVENERVFGDVYVTQQTRNLLYCADGYQFPSLYERRRCNLIQKEWKGPDFMELNRKKPIRRASFVPLEAEKRKRLKRSKSMGDTRNVAVDWTTASDGIKSDVNNICKPKVRIFVSNKYFSSSSSLHFSTFTKGLSRFLVFVSPQSYPPPLPNPPVRKEGAVSSLVDQLLLDIYGLPDGDRRRSESDSTASSLRIHPQHQHLQKARLLWKSKNNSITDGNDCVRARKNRSRS